MGAMIAVNAGASVTLGGVVAGVGGGEVIAWRCRQPLVSPRSTNQRQRVVTMEIFVGKTFERLWQF